MWDGNWVPFLDTMLQIQVLALPGHALRLPTRIKMLKIDPRVHNDHAKQLKDETNGKHYVVLLTIDYHIIHVWGYLYII